VSFGPPSNWWTDLKGLDKHPVAHALGGLAFFGATFLYRWLFHHVPFPVFAAFVASGAQLVWEVIQVEVTPGYSFKDSGVWDWLTATIFAFAAAGLLSWLM